MTAPASGPPSRLLSHFHNRGSKQQSSGWAELWETDQSDLWDRGKPSAALVEYIESRPQVLSSITDKYRPKALIPACATARRYAEAELAEPSEHNYHNLDAASCAFTAGVEARNVTVIAGDFFQKDWEPQGLGGFDLVYDYTFLCALHPSLRQAWARRMHELLSPDGVLICLEFPLYKGLTIPGPPWGLKGVYWNLLAVGGDGIIHEPGEEEEIEKEGGPFGRVLHFKPPNSYEVGKGTDMISVWTARPWRFPDDMCG